MYTVPIFKISRFYHTFVGVRLFPVTGVVVSCFQATNHQTAVLAKFGLYVLDVGNFLCIRPFK